MTIIRIAVLALCLLIFISQSHLAYGTQVRYEDYLVSIAWSPGETYLAMRSTDGTLTIQQVLTGEVLYRVADKLIYPSQLVWSPTGQYISLVYDFGDKVAVVDPYQDEIILDVQIGVNRETIINKLSWSPNGKTLAVASQRGTGGAAWYATHLFEIPGGAEQILYDWGGYSIEWHPEQPLLAVSTTYWDIPLQIIDLDTGSLHTSFDVITIYMHWSPDGTRIAAIDYLGSELDDTEASVEIWELSSGTLLNEIILEVGNAPTITDFDWHPDSEKLLIAQSGVGIMIWDVDSDQVDTVITLPDAVGINADWSPSGAYIAYSTLERGTDIFIFDVPDGFLPSVQMLHAKINECIFDQSLNRELHDRVIDEAWQNFIALVQADSGERISVNCAEGLVKIGQFFMDNDQP